ncbi:MAG: hypothetical protein WA800_16480, partial [Terriglobales bacterium]
MSRPHARTQICVRVIADLAIVNATLLLSLLPQVWMYGKPRPLLSLWLRAALLLSCLGPAISYASGLYTKGRFYASKYKALIVLQSVALLFTAVSLLLYFVRLAPSYP